MEEKVLTSEEYQTLFSEISTCINSRPLWPVSEGDLEETPITCNDLLRLGGGGGGLGRDPITMNLSCNPRKRYNYIQSIADEWWKIWIRNFVPNLQVRSKWFKNRENISIVDMILLKDDSIPRGKWNRAIVDDVFPGIDRRVRSARIRTNNNILNRPITKLILLLSHDEMKN